MDIAEPDLLRIIERWQHDAALTAHFAQPHMATFNAAMAGAKILGALVKADAGDYARTLVRD